MDTGRRQRILAVDLLRGTTVALMILVNNPGSWGHVAGPLRHAAWHGLTFADLVFPFFLFIVGVSLALSFGRRRDAGAGDGDLLRKILVRSVVIFACGALLNAFPYGIPLGPSRWREFGWGDLADPWLGLRIMGVLQRIALCYLLAGLVYLSTDRARERLAAALALLAVYEAAMRLPLVPGWGAGDFGATASLARWIDLRVLGEAHMLRPGGVPFEPEGLLTTLPATGTVLLGMVVGERLRAAASTEAAWRPVAIGGALVAAVGLALVPVEPLNKQLWTSTYVAVTGGLAAVALAACGWAARHGFWRRALGWSEVFGANPLLAFLGSGVGARLLTGVRWPVEAGERSLHGLLMGRTLVPALGIDTASLVFALLQVALWWALLRILHRRGLYLRV